MINILFDENIPFAEEAFSGLGKVQLKQGRDITNSDLQSIDVLIVRSVTRVNEILLKGTPVKFVGTATIGTDHLDIEYLRMHNIKFESAPGCNSFAVVEYIFTALVKLAAEYKISLSEKSIGIIGYGNIGSKIAKIADSFGIKTLINDPPLQRATNNNFFVSYEDAIKSDIITFHVPLNLSGVDKTFHMLSDENLKNFGSDKIILNSSRGSVIANNDLKNIIKQNKNLTVLDVWENEPRIDIDLLQIVKFGSPHIAGYSLEGKVNGTMIVYDKLCNHLNINPDWKPLLPTVENSELSFEQTNNIEESFNKLFSKIYRLEKDDTNFRKIIALEEKDRGKYFDQLRKNYPVRREFSNYSVKINSRLEREINILHALRFNVIPI